jgi:hypothetical protein
MTSCLTAAVGYRLLRRIVKGDERRGDRSIQSGVAGSSL